MSWEPWGTRIIAIVGAALGVTNTIAGYYRSKPRLRIIEDYRPISKVGDFPPMYEIRLENRGQVPIAVEQVDLELIKGGEKRSIQLWTKRGERRVVEPHRVETFSLPGDALFEATRKKKVWIVVKTETAGTIKRRGRKFWSIASDYAALVEISTRGGEGDGFPM